MTRPIGELIPKIVQQALTTHQTIQQLQQEWRRLVGKELAGHTRPASLRHKTLCVYTDEPGASFLLAMEKDALLAKLNQRTHGQIEELIIRPGEIS
ncbi:MAG: DUF721 domain-containing protein [Candidatus Omnitrophica bacterium]|nr:DUF721 domain-containing protein [Candidatus Omnitrophota bacterium]